jgi:hypothetical protein
MAPPRWDVERPGRSGAAARLTPKPATTRSPCRSRRIPASLALTITRSFGHFRRSGRPGRRVHSLDERQSGRKRQGMGRGIALCEPHHRASEEIAGLRHPFAALATLPRSLLERDQPIALDRGFVGQQVRIGRAGALDDSDSAQKQRPSGALGKRPERSDQQIAERRNDDRRERDQAPSIGWRTRTSGSATSSKYMILTIFR